MKKQLIFVIIALALSSFACSISNIEMKTIDTQTVMINEALPTNLAETELAFTMTGGTFNITPGSTKLVTGAINYNVEDWEPQFTRSNNLFEIKQVNPYRISGIPTNDVVNEWNFALSSLLPLSLEIEGGASENDFNLTGLQLTNLKIIQGASKTTVHFDAPNPVNMDEFTFTTGASSASLTGLGNANFNTMSFSAGAGDYTLDFTGTLAHDAEVDIKATISNITIIIPAGMKAVIINDGTVSNFNTEGTWLLSDDTYTTMEEGPTLTINLDMAVGNVTLIHLDS
ncbi:hypothetical protein JR338_00885 [Chloroflexota bacterium]|nr:hypothetical protein JR338_00885 [Chloroflexota bacterium]